MRHRVGAAVLAFYGENDTRVTAQALEVIAAMTAAGVPFDYTIHPDAGHAFSNFEDRYRPGPSRDAWRRTLAWLSQYLSA